MDASDQELQQYLFDLQGYLVIHNVLGAAEVAELNRLIDAGTGRVQALLSVEESSSGPYAHRGSSKAADRAERAEMPDSDGGLRVPVKITGN